jgi:putative membrane protein
LFVTKGKTMKTSTLVSALALAFAIGAVQAQGTGGSLGGGTAPGTAGSGSSATGGQAAPMAQPGTGTRNLPSKKDDAVARGDRKFIETAASSGMFEVQVSQLAASKATDAQVKSYASMLVDHHTAANNELVKIANAKGVELPAAPKRALRKDIEQLGKKSGAEFDRAYVRDVGIKAHEKDIKLFEKASKDAKDAELKAFVDKTLPTLRDHLAQAQKLPQAGKKSASAGASRGVVHSSVHNKGS